PDNYPEGKITANNQPLRDQKGSVYEGGIRVPCVARWPGKLIPGKYPGVVHITDWMPTFCALTGYQPKTDLKWDGLNLWPQLSGAEPAKPRAFYVAGPGFKSRAVRDGDWKLVVSEGKKDASAGKAELFNIASDPNETTDLASKEPQKVEAMRARL